MAAEMEPNRVLQAASFATLGLFVAGNFVPAIGVWTGAVLGAWFVGTQPPLRGIALWAAIAIVLRLVFHATALVGGEWPVWEGMLAGLFVGLLPLLFYRLSQGARFAATLALPLWSVTVYGLVQTFLPAIAPQASADAALFAFAGPAFSVFAINWFAATVVWLWNWQITPALVLIDGALIVALCWTLARYALPAMPQITSPWSFLPIYVVPCALGGVLLLLWSALKAVSNKRLLPESVALLRSPVNGETLRMEKQALVGTSSGKRFTIKHGIPQFVDPKSLTGLNRKYNRLYQTIGGFYDNSQRVYFALTGLERRKYFMQYLGLLETKPGDKVLETSVGTALNFFYLPRGLKLFGLDLSGEMLANAQVYLTRQNIPAALFLGNAEALPFADNCMDVVFHTGGINFFDDKAKAIREMIRVAKPGSRILIADETEKLAKKIYERTPITSGYFKGRETEISTPVHLVPPEMEKIEVHLLRHEEFYALTFRKPKNNG